MDWRRSIIILIVSFVLLNISLVLNLWSKGNPSGFSLTDSQQKEILASMKQKGINMETSLPNKGRPQAFLELGYEKIDEDGVVVDFLGKDAKPENKAMEGGKSYTLGVRQLVIMDNGIINYFDSPEDNGEGEITREQAVKTAEEFLKKRGSLPKDAMLFNVTYDDKSRGYVVEYVRSYDGFFIANSRIYMLVTSAGVSSYYQCWLKPYGYSGSKREVIIPTMAILRVQNAHGGTSPLTITKIDQGYYSKFYDADRWQAAPVWRIQLKNGEMYYVNAFTGELEQ